MMLNSVWWCDDTGLPVPEAAPRVRQDFCVTTRQVSRKFRCACLTLGGEVAFEVVTAAEWTQGDLGQKIRGGGGRGPHVADVGR